MGNKNSGRKPKPTNIHLINGNPSKKALNKSEPKPKASKVTPPAHLNATAKAEWRRVSKELEALELLTVIDRAALAAYCHAYSQWVASVKELNKPNVEMVIKAPSGYPVQNPYIAIGNKALDKMHKFAVEFGMTPSARTRISVEAGKPNTDGLSEWDALEA